MEDKHEKILFRFHSNIFDKEMVETMWAFVVDEDKGLYKMDNIPFYAPSIASGDLIFAEYDDREQMLTHRDTVSFSGNSVIQIVVMDRDKNVNELRNLFLGKGCESEKFNDRYFSMEIPLSVNYNPIKAQLDALEKSEIIGYAEPCLSDKHREDLD